MLHFIVAPYHLGQRGVAAGAGPLRVLASGIAAQLGATVSQMDIGPAGDWRDVNLGIAEAVRQSRGQGELPVVVAGNCNSCLGTLAGIDSPDAGIVWFDAHADFHTRETTVSGSLEGMSLTLATEQLVPAHRVVLAGGRDLDPGEDERVRERLLHIPDGNLRWRGLRPCEEVYVHIDVDVLDPAISPGVNFQGPGGLDTQTLTDALAFTFESRRVAAVAVVNYNPDRDQANRTRNIIVELLRDIDRLRRTHGTR